nr:hypothetical protein CFP56_36219 [Quercus suber]
MSYSGGQQISHYEYGPPALCGKTFADANATGIVYINPNVVQSPQSGQPDNDSGLTQNSAWALTIQNAYGATNAASELSASVGAWYDTNGANYADDIHLGYDVCALALGFANPYAVYRGQSDNGTCLATFDAPCINALKTSASTYAEWLVGGNHGTQTNITDTSLPLICNDIATMIAANIPEECSAYFDEPLAIGGPLTTVDDDYAVFLNDSCRINGTFQNVLNFSTNSSLPVYTNETELIVPVMTVFMPIANQNLIATISQAVTELTCLHINTINPGSYVPPPMAEVASPNSSDSNGLSGGAIAGIAIGVVLAIALLGGLAFWFWRRRRANRQGGSGSAWRPDIGVNLRRMAGRAYFDEPLAIGGPLTTVDDDYAVFLNDSCRINGTFQNVLNFSTNSSLPVYTNETELIVPVMTVFMPIANQNLIATISQAVTELTCLHINTINPGSYVPPPMAEVASPNSSDSNGLSGGAIAGIAIGVVLAIALLGGLAFWFWRRRRANRQGGSGSAWRPMNQADAKELAGIHVAAAPDDGARYEFPAEPTKRYELGSMDPKRANELEGKTRYELA